MADHEKQHYEIERVSDTNLPNGKERAERELFTAKDEAQVIRKLDRRLLREYLRRRTEPGAD